MATVSLSVLGSPKPAAAQESSDQSTALLTEAPEQVHKNSSSPSSVSLIVMMAVTTVSLAAAVALGFMFFISRVSTSGAPLLGLARRQTKLQHPVVILVSSDGFRFGYQYKTHTPNIDRLIADGTMAETGMIPVFPTLTFPNHYSIATGLYPAWHGIINNHFKDPITNETFGMQNHEPKWWLGEPLWETVTKNGLQAATYFWPGSEVVKGPWDCPEGFCQPYNGSVPFEERVDTVLGYFDLPDAKRPRFMTLYFEDPDHQGHMVGPDDPQITDAVAHIDSLMGKLIQGLERRGIFEDVTIIMVGDHGMVGTCDQKLIFLEDLSPWIEISYDWVQSYSPVLAIRPPPGVSPKEVVAKMTEGLNSGKVKNGEYLKVYLKEDLPKRLHYQGSDRIPPIIGMVQEGFKVEQKSTKHQECGGAHGYDNAFFSMRTIFFAHGPRFARGRKVPSFENVEIYNMITSILNIHGAPTNGTPSFANTVLLPTP
uniref:Sulfatase N-terminal domain-containing protein n=1 Tax=Araucaria cunninghamii TaxID=56994 RepID=A0A0D6QVP6_ARACU